MINLCFVLWRFRLTWIGCLWESCPALRFKMHILFWQSSRRYVMLYFALLCGWPNAIDLLLLLGHHINSMLPFCWLQQGFENTPGPNFIKPVTTTICLAWNFRITGLRTKFPHDFQDLANNSWIQVTSNMQHMKIWLVILFLPRKKFHAKQIFVLSGSWNWAQVWNTPGNSADMSCPVFSV